MTKNNIRKPKDQNEAIKFLEAQGAIVTFINKDGEVTYGTNKEKKINGCISCQYVRLFEDKLTSKTIVYCELQKEEIARCEDVYGAYKVLKPFCPCK